MAMGGRIPGSRLGAWVPGALTQASGLALVPRTLKRGALLCLQFQGGSGRRNGPRLRSSPNYLWGWGWGWGGLSGKRHQFPRTLGSAGNGHLLRLETQRAALLAEGEWELG